MTPQDIADALDQIETSPYRDPRALYAARPGTCVATPYLDGRSVGFRRKGGRVVAELWYYGPKKNGIPRVTVTPLGGALAERAGRLIDRRP